MPIRVSLLERGGRRSERLENSRMVSCQSVGVLVLLATLLLLPPTKAHNVSEIEHRLQRLNKPAVTSIQSPDGDTIDCIAVENQPAFDHPELSASSIQALPVQIPNDLSQQAEGAAATQLWRMSGQCPAGTIPVRRTSVHDILRSGTPAAMYGRKSHRAAHHRKRRYLPPGPAPAGFTNHEHAIAYVQGGSYYGATANINVWNPRIQGKQEFSLSQIWVLGGSFDGSVGNSIEAGWQVFPGMYGDQNPRLFIYWTSDSYEETGCYNLLCSGFIQTSNEIVIGGAIAPSSSSDGSQYDISILIWKDPVEGNWWLQYGSKLVGYWPAQLFSELSTKGASTVEWGGEIVDSRPAGEHTATMMGSGLYAEAGFARASYFRDLRVVNEFNSLQLPSGLRTYAADSSCYDIVTSMDKSWGSYFFYGGPGRNPSCK